MKELIKFWLGVFIIGALAVVSLSLGGCAEKTIYVDRIVKVNVPVPCKTKEVAKAKKGVNDADSLLDIRRERDELRVAQEVCR